MSSKTVQVLGRRLIASSKALKPARGGGGVPYENPSLKGDHHGRAGLNWGTGYFPVGNTPGKKLAIGGGLTGILVGGVGAVLWTCWRQGQWSK
mmetsp:Transcript_21327/g.53531  ORF Transcript_21327/g.53531 Transcript_21327/m.53531 type:complete len:93 (+) Transcript_21327:29-307(+)